MSVELTPELQRFVATQIASGGFRDEQSVIEAAVALMQATEQKRLAFLQQAITGSEADLAAGLGQDYTPELLTQMLDEASRRVEQRTPINPDVIG